MMRQNIGTVAGSPNHVLRLRMHMHAEIEQDLLKRMARGVVVVVGVVQWVDPTVLGEIAQGTRVPT